MLDLQDVVVPTRTMPEPVITFHEHPSQHHNDHVQSPYRASETSLVPIAWPTLRIPTSPVISPNAATSPDKQSALILIDSALLACDFVGISHYIVPVVTNVRFFLRCTYIPYSSSLHASETLRFRSVATANITPPYKYFAIKQ